MYRFSDSTSDQLFAVFDKDGRGGISLDELRTRLLENVGKEKFKDEYTMSDASIDKIFEAVDLDGNGTIDWDELRQYLLSKGYPELVVDTVFQSMDANSDGELSRAEFQKGFKKYELVREAISALVMSFQESSVLKPGHSAIKEAFTLLDLNSDGIISDQEFRTFFRMYRFSDSTSDQLFAVFDKDGRGGISLDELRTRLLENVGKEKFKDEYTMSDASIDKIFEAVDLDGNGTIDWDELRQYLLSKGYPELVVDTVFQSMDANSDGELSRVEFQKGFKKYELVREAISALVMSFQESSVLKPGRSAIKEAFTLLDLNVDGTISDQEFRTFFRMYRFSDSTSDQLFAMFDKDGRGGISLDELRSRLWESVGKENFKDEYTMSDASIDKIFEAVDLDGNGRIDYDELRSYLLSAGYPEIAVEGVFHSMDANSDGELSRVEFQEGFKKYALVREAIGRLRDCAE